MLLCSNNVNGLVKKTNQAPHRTGDSSCHCRSNCHGQGPNCSQPLRTWKQRQWQRQAHEQAQPTGQQPPGGRAVVPPPPPQQQQPDKQELQAEQQPPGGEAVPLSLPPQPQPSPQHQQQRQQPPVVESLEEGELYEERQGVAEEGLTGETASKASSSSGKAGGRSSSSSNGARHTQQSAQAAAKAAQQISSSMYKSAATPAAGAAPITKASTATRDGQRCIIQP